MRRSSAILVLLFVAALAAHGGLVYAALAKPGSSVFFDAEVVRGRGCDFYALYTAGHNLRHGRSVYDEGPAAVKTPCRFGFRYLPVAAAAGVPLSFLSPRAAYKTWILLIELAFVAGLYCVWLLARKNASAFVPLAAVWLVFTPMYLELRLGQYSLVQAVLVTIAATAYRSGANRLGTGFFTASLCFKLNTWLAAPALLRERRKEPLLIGAAILAATSIPHFLIFPDSIASFVGNLGTASVSAAHGFTRGNLSLSMLAGIVWPRAFSATVVNAIFVLVVAAGCVTALRSKKMDLADQLAFWLALSLLAYKHTWEHHYVMALPLITLLALRGRTIAFWIGTALLAMPTPYYFFRGSWTPFEQFVHHGQKPIGLIILLVAMLMARKG
ncbi:MAG: DUF2029 domain-containing protein [Deltaproteobacteria bacterium]|nr:DUF2029 domain-containing protein [Deltaproteobacteria bacterium]